MKILVSKILIIKNLPLSESKTLLTRTSLLQHPGITIPSGSGQKAKLAHLKHTSLSRAVCRLCPYSRDNELPRDYRITSSSTSSTHDNVIASPPTVSLFSPLRIFLSSSCVYTIYLYTRRQTQARARPRGLSGGRPAQETIRAFQSDIAA